MLPPVPPPLPWFLPASPSAGKGDSAQARRGRVRPLPQLFLGAVERRAGEPRTSQNGRGAHHAENKPTSTVRQRYRVSLIRELLRAAAPGSMGPTDTPSEWGRPGAESGAKFRELRRAPTRRSRTSSRSRATLSIGPFPSSLKPSCRQAPIVFRPDVHRLRTSAPRPGNMLQARSRTDAPEPFRAQFALSSIPECAP